MRTTYDAPGALFHTTGRVNWQAWHLDDPERGDWVLACLGRHLELRSMDAFGYVIMSNHYHAAVRSPGEERYRQLTGRRTRCRHFRPWPQGHPNASVLSQAMRGFLHEVAARAQRELGLRGHFWERNFHARRLLDPFDLVTAIAYDHRNPVRAGMTLFPDEYPRSSAAWWAGSGAAAIPLLGASALPFGLDHAELRQAVRQYQNARELDDALKSLAKEQLRRDTPEGRARLCQLLEEAGLAALTLCGSAAACGLRNSL
ncbi:MAG: transposase [Planctomycetaceae bacterium]